MIQVKDRKANFPKGYWLVIHIVSYARGGFSSLIHVLVCSVWRVYVRHGSWNTNTAEIDRYYTAVLILWKKGDRFENCTTMRDKSATKRSHFSNKRVDFVQTPVATFTFNSILQPAYNTDNTLREHGSRCNRIQSTFRRFHVSL